MKPASTALINLLLTGNFVQADLYTFTLAQGGAVGRNTTADVDIQVAGVTWNSKSVGIDADAGNATGHWKVGLDVDTWTVYIQPRSVDPLTGASFPDLINGQPWLAAARVGALDGCVVQVDRVYLPAWPQPWTSPVVVSSDFLLQKIFLGTVATVDIRKTYVILTINSAIDLIVNTQMPRNLFQTSCRHTLFDSGCTLNAASFAVNGSIASVTSPSQIVPVIAAPGGSGTYALGRVVFTSGLNMGFARMIKTWNSSGFGLISPLPYPITPGDTITAYPGCNKSLAQCDAFANSPNFGGQPFIPLPETAV